MPAVCQARGAHLHGRLWCCGWAGEPCARSSLAAGAVPIATFSVGFIGFDTQCLGVGVAVLFPVSVGQELISLLLLIK